MKQRFYRFLASIVAILPAAAGKAMADNVPFCCTSSIVTAGTQIGCNGAVTQYNCGSGKVYTSCSACQAGYILTPQTGATNCNQQITYQVCHQSNPVCSSGQYFNSSTGCVPCPGTGTSYSGATSITQCFIPSGEVFSDPSGKWRYATNCYYKN